MTASTARANPNTTIVKSVFTALLSLDVTLTHGKDAAIGGLAELGRSKLLIVRLPGLAVRSARPPHRVTTAT